MALSESQKDVILHKLAEVASEINPQSGLRKKAGLSLADKERLVSTLLNDPTGRGK